MRAGFTGTQDGLTSAQGDALVLLLVELKITHLVHGDCIGADEAAHAVAMMLNCTTEIWPCTITSKRANCVADTEHSPMAPLERNWKIAQESILIACPKTNVEVLRSGTWSTIRYGRKLKSDVRIIYPDGSIMSV